MSGHIQNIVIVGGGAAGWLTAGLVAAEHRRAGQITVTLVESPDVPILGVGEGTWPSMRMTLQRIGLSETTFIRHCDASFKQGTRFVNWQSATAPASYTHPFSLPADYGSLNLANHWLAQARANANGEANFADFVTPQAALAARGLAPKQAATPEYAFNLNYGYHLDAGKFATLLQQHAVEQLGVRHVRANVTAIDSAENGDIARLQLDRGSALAGDLFVDCTGSQALLIGKHYGTVFKSLKPGLCNDRALAAQVPYADTAAPIASTTLSTALSQGWVWDIGLQSRRGVGFVYSADHCDESQARQLLADYLQETAPHAAMVPSDFRALKFNPGHYEQFWVNNCVAIGMSAGFVEPLEASALALVEQGAALLADQLPQTRALMAPAARRFNHKMQYHWRAIVDFLKLHYVLSERDDTSYWRDMRNLDQATESLRDRLQLWQQQAPWHEDAPRVDELFPSASYQYVLYGMGFAPAAMNFDRATFAQQQARAVRVTTENRQRIASMASALPTNRALLQHIMATGLPR